MVDRPVIDIDRRGAGCDADNVGRLHLGPADAIGGAGAQRPVSGKGGRPGIDRIDLAGVAHIADQIARRIAAAVAARARRQRPAFDGESRRDPRRHPRHAAMRIAVRHLFLIVEPAFILVGQLHLDPARLHRRIDPRAQRRISQHLAPARQVGDHHLPCIDMRADGLAAPLLRLCGHRQNGEGGERHAQCLHFPASP